MISSSKVSCLVVAIHMTVCWTSSLSAQSHGIASNSLLTPKKSAKEMLSIAFGADETVRKATVAELSGSKSANRSTALQNAFSSRPQSDIGRLQSLDNQLNIQRYIDKVDWDSAFDGMKVEHNGPSKGRLPQGESLLNSQFSTKKLFNQKSSRGITGNGWSERTNTLEGLE